MEEIGNRYQMAVLAFLKAKQIRKESPLLNDSEVISQAVNDVLEGKVKYKQVNSQKVEEKLPVVEAKTPPPMAGKEKPSPAKPKKEKTKKKKEKKKGKKK